MSSPFRHFWQPKLKAGTEHRFHVILINDRHRAVDGRFVLTLESASGKIVTQAERAFALESLGRQQFSLALTVPAGTAGKHLLRATAAPGNDWPEAPTVSRRRVEVAADAD